MTAQRPTTTATTEDHKNKQPTTDDDIQGASAINGLRKEHSDGVAGGWTIVPAKAVFVARHGERQQNYHECFSNSAVRGSCIDSANVPTIHNYRFLVNQSCSRNMYRDDLGYELGRTLRLT